jgi:4-amino-4-deoxy-L-arabinose transferase-like glycosyltransferase
MAQRHISDSVYLNLFSRKGAAANVKTLPKIVLIALFIAWILPGLVGRDLWKADEPYSFGLVNHIVKTNDWVVPTLAGEPFMEKPPLYYITSAAFGRLFSRWLKLHDAARLASGFFMMLTLLFAGLTARELFGKGYEGTAALILIGCVGLQLTAHKLITDVGMLTGIAVALYGLALSRRRHILGGFWLGTGMGIGFLTKGLLAPGLIGLTAIMLPTLFASWRKREYFFSLLIAAAAALPWAVIWPYALYQRSPQLFNEWFWFQNMGRFLGYAHVGPKNVPGFFLYTLPWFALPALPLALWTLWEKRRSWPWREDPSIQLPLTAFLVMLIALSVSANARSLYTLPMLLPLTLLAAAGIGSLTNNANNVLNQLNIWLFGLVAGLLWLGWLAMVTGHPGFVAHAMHRLSPASVLTFNGFHFAVAFVYSVAWIFIVFRFTRSGVQPVMNWTVGMVLTWALFMTLWLPFLDAKSGYCSLLTSLKEAIPARHGVIASHGVGESERAMVEYYTGITTRRFEVHEDLRDADLLLMESGSVPVDPPAGVRWRLLWEGKKLGDRGKAKEIFRLYQRVHR